MSTRFRALLLSAVAGLLAGANPSVAAVRSAPVGTGNDEVVRLAATGQDESATSGYWTPHRMINAKTATASVKRARPLTGRAPEKASGRKVSVPPTGPRGPQPNKIAAVPKPYNDYPDKLNGKVFFTDSQGDDYMCSGTAVNSPNKSVVWTAGHCVHDGNGGNFYHNWVFVPGYLSGNAPYGRWAASQLLTLDGWSDRGDFRYDLGAAVVKPLNGERLADRIGGHGMLFNAPRSQTWNIFGYPASGGYSGKAQYKCVSRYLGDDFTWGSGPPTLKIACGLPEGSSGGAWLVKLSNGFGKINSVTSYGRTEARGMSYGPYQGDDALGLYNSAGKLNP